MFNRKQSGVQPLLDPLCATSMSGRRGGLHSWLLQRISGAFLLLTLLLLLGLFLFNPPADHAAWRAWFSAPVPGTIALLFVIALVLHAWIGFRDVVLDYLHPVSLRLLVLAVSGLALVGSGLWMLRILFLANIT